MTRGAKTTKVPVQVSLSFASSTDSATWCSYRVAKLNVHNAAGLGFVLSSSDDIYCIDLDNCIGDDGQLSPLAQSVLDIAGKTYVEYSPSGKGLHIWLRGQCGQSRARKGFELYTHSRFLCMTGRPFVRSSTLAHVDASAFDSIAS